MHKALGLIHCILLLWNPQILAFGSPVYKHHRLQTHSLSTAMSSQEGGRNAITTPVAPFPLCDIGVNLTNRAFRNHWRNVVARAQDANVRTLVLTGTSVHSSRQSLELAQTWTRESGSQDLFVTVGVHPHDAKTFDDNTLDEMRSMLSDPLAKAVGECGLDFNRNYSPKDAQIHAFRQQVSLACELNIPLFLHEREAHEDLVKVLDEFESLPPVVIHCFTGLLDEALAYLERGYMLGFTGTICKSQRGAPLREIIRQIPLERIMIETDCPFMGFVKGRKGSEPADVVGVAEQISDVLDIHVKDVCQVTTETTKAFFRI
jgi:TatD DNase family protein